MNTQNQPGLLNKNIISHTVKYIKSFFTKDNQSQSLGSFQAIVTLRKIKNHQTKTILQYSLMTFQQQRQYVYYINIRQTKPGKQYVFPFHTEMDIIKKSKVYGRQQIQWNADKQTKVNILINQEQCSCCIKWMAKLFYQMLNKKNCKYGQHLQCIKESVMNNKRKSEIQFAVQRLSFLVKFPWNDNKQSQYKHLQQLLKKLSDDIEIKIAAAGSYYIETRGITKLIAHNCIFFIRQHQDFCFELFIMNDRQEVYIKNNLEKIHYQFSIPKQQIKFIQNEEQYSNSIKIFRFDSIDSIITLKQNMIEYSWEITRHQRMSNVCLCYQVFPYEQIQFLKKIIPNSQSDNSGYSIFTTEKFKKLAQDKAYFFQRIIVYSKIIDCVFITKQDIVQIYVEHKQTHQYIVLIDYQKAAQFKPLNYQNKSIIPTRFILYSNDQKAIVNNKIDPNKLYQICIDEGKIVRQYVLYYYKQFQKQIIDFSKNTHNIQQQFLLVSNKYIYKFSPSLINQYYQIIVSYKSVNNFSAITSAQSEKFITGAQDGSIRFYQENGFAKNKYPGFGKSIQHIQISNNNEYIVATSEKQLIFFQLVEKEQKIKRSNIFSRNLIHEKKIPLKLKINLQDEHKFNMKNYQFIKAKFLQHQQQTYIYCIATKYVLLWKVQQILKGCRFAYKIINIDQIIISGEIINRKYNLKLITALKNQIRIHQLKL